MSVLSKLSNDVSRKLHSAFQILGNPDCEMTNVKEGHEDITSTASTNLNTLQLFISQLLMTFSI